MIFEKLELVNFKSHINTSIEFNHGITLIIGENGAGKSSIFEAITFALFSESQVNNIDLVRTNKGLDDRIVMKVALTFVASASRYRVERTVTKKNAKQTSAARLYKITDAGDVLITEGVTRVNSEIQTILSMNSKTFLNAIHIRQGEISSLIDDTPAERKKLIGQLLRLDDLERAHRAMPEIIHDFEFIKTDIGARITDEAELEKELDLNTSLKGEAEVQNVQFTNELEALKKDYEQMESEKETLDLQKQKLERVKIRLQNDILFKEKLKQTNADLSGKLKEIESNEQEMAALKPLVLRLDTFTRFKDCLVRFNLLKKDETSKTEALDKITSYRQILESEKQSHDRYIELDGQLKELNISKAKLESEIRMADDLNRNRQKSESLLDRHTEVLNDVYQKIEDILGEYDVKDIEDKSLIEISETVDGLAGEITAGTSEIDEQINELNTKIGSLKQEIASSTKQLRQASKLENKCPTCQSDISPDKKNQLINSYETVISAGNDEIEKTRSLIDDLNSRKSSNTQETKVLDGLKNDISRNLRIPDEINRLKGEIEETDLKISALNDKRVMLEQTLEDISQKSDEMGSLEEGYKKYVDAQTLLKGSGSEENIKNELLKITGELKDVEDEMNALCQNDTELSADIEPDRLELEIRSLGEKKVRYNNLEGSIKDKADYENKLKINRKEIENNQAVIDKTVKIIESCSYDSEVHTKITESVSSTGVKINEIIKNIAVNDTRIQTFAEKITDISRKLEENRKYKAQYEATCEYIDILSDFKELYGKNGIQKDLRAQSKPLIQKFTREFFEKFNFNYSDLKLSDEYDITIYGPDGEVRLNMVSGGEKIAIALSLRLGITQVMSRGNIETILLDEPTIHLDSFRRQELISVLRSMSVIPQMIIVTHDEELETAADSLIKVVKDDGFSKVIDD